MTSTTELDQPGADQDREGGVQVDASGMLKDSRGKWLSGQKPPTAIATSERGRELANRRWAKAAQEARKAIVEAAQAGGIDAHTSVEAWGAAVGEVYKGAVAKGIDAPHDAARALAFVGKATELLRPQERAASVQANVLVAVSGGPELDAIEAEWTEG